jgi:DNA-directed RNA polymerase specialized sigma24 family protein
LDTHLLAAFAPDEGYELFRRAIMEHDDEAWNTIYTRYRPLLLVWTRHRSARTAIGEHSDDIADRALARAWAALSPERFVQFPSLAALLAYLRSCVTAAVIDCARAQASRERVFQRLEVGMTHAPEHIVLDQFDRAELWRLVSKAPTTEQERTVLAESFVLDLPPRAIQARHPELFASITDVYSAKRNLLNRLQRNPDLKRLHQEMQSA